MRKFIFLISFLLVLALGTQPLVCAGNYNSQVELHSEIVYVASADSGDAVFDLNSSVRCAPAALTSIVTAMIVIATCPDLSEKATVPDNIAALIAGTNSATISLVAGEQMPLSDLLYSILIRSASDASVTLACFVAGDLTTFVEMMNRYVSDLGCTDTNFVNVHGLDADGQYTTARDVYKIVKNAADSPVFCEIASATEHEVPATNKADAFKIYTTNYMLKSIYPDYYNRYVLWGKTGATTNAGRCFAGIASKNGYTYIAVVMKGVFVDTDGNGEKENFAFIDCDKMLTWAFANIRLRVIANASLAVTEIEVRNSLKTDHLILVPEKEVTALVPSAVTEDSVLIEVIQAETKEFVRAPVDKGTVLGKARILYANEEIAVVNLVASEDIKFDSAGTFRAIVKTVFTSPVFILILLLVLAAAAAYFIFGVRYDKKRGRISVINTPLKTKLLSVFGRGKMPGAGDIAKRINIPLDDAGKKHPGKKPKGKRRIFGDDDSNDSSSPRPGGGILR